LKQMVAAIRDRPKSHSLAQCAARCLSGLGILAAVLGGRAAVATAASPDPDAVPPLSWGADPVPSMPVDPRPRGDARAAKRSPEARRRARHRRYRVISLAPRRTASPAADRACLRALANARVPFVELPALRGVRTPIEMFGPIGGVELVPRAGRAAVMDCQLARALVETAPLLRDLRVDGLAFSGAYDYRLRHHARKLSEHAHGLAIDVHAIRTAAGWLEVERDFARDPGGWRPPRAGSDTLASCVGAPVLPAGRFLRTVACALALHPAFHRVLTPDFDGDHYNHFHLEAYPDGAPPLVAGAVERSSTRSGLIGPRRR